MPDKTKNGPSPRVWGILGIGGRTCFTLRSIPTRVGNISLYLYTCTTITVHPHACGEYLVKQPGCAVQLGPSPRVWGIRHDGRDKRLIWRSIPTRVGNTTCSTAGAGQPRVHPHACGEYAAPATETPTANGPFPRVWGIRPEHPGKPIGNRSIPTRVGNTFSSVRVACATSDHPHACGEYYTMVMQELPAVGPSPRVWGIPSPCTPALSTCRSIPTRVGNTESES